MKILEWSMHVYWTVFSFNYYITKLFSLRETNCSSCCWPSQYNQTKKIKRKNYRVIQDWMWYFFYFLDLNFAVALIQSRTFQKYQRKWFKNKKNIRMENCKIEHESPCIINSWKRIFCLRFSLKVNVFRCWIFFLSQYMNPKQNSIRHNFFFLWFLFLLVFGDVETIKSKFSLKTFYYYWVNYIPENFARYIYAATK